MEKVVSFLSFDGHAVCYAALRIHSVSRVCVDVRDGTHSSLSFLDLFALSARKEKEKKERNELDFIEERVFAEGVGVGRPCVRCEISRRG